jgi:3-isopropylmalate dehydrogenase
MKLAVIPGDGIGVEVTAEALKVLGKLVPDLETTEYDLGARRYNATGELLPADELDQIRQHDAILLGAIGDPRIVAPGILERGLLLNMRFQLDHHVNLRPAQLYPGALSPLAAQPEIDFVVVREGTEGPYTGNGGAIRVGTDHEIATEVSINTWFGADLDACDRDRRSRVPGRRNRVLPHRCCHHLHGHRPVALRRHRHGQPLR